MRHLHLRTWAALALLLAAVSAFASAPIMTPRGSERDHWLDDLQVKVDHLLGRDHLNVHTDYIGAHAGDPRPWSWVNDGNHPVAVTLIDRDVPKGVIGWYEETGYLPVIDGMGDGVALKDLNRRSTQTLLRLPAGVKRFGFYTTLKPVGAGQKVGECAVLYTNNLLNEQGTHGEGRTDEPRRVYVYDVSRWLGAGTWLVASPMPSEDDPLDNASSHCRRDDDDNASPALLFTVSALGATPTHHVSFTEVKALFR